VFFVAFVDDSFGGVIIGNHLKKPQTNSTGSFLGLFRDFSRRFPGLFRNAASNRSRTMTACSALHLNEALQTF